MITHSLSMRCNASLMSASSDTDCCNSIFRKYMYSLMCGISASTNNIVQSFASSDVYNSCALHIKGIRAIYTLYFIYFIHFYFLVTMDIMHIAYTFCLKQKTD